MWNRVEYNNVYKSTMCSLLGLLSHVIEADFDMKKGQLSDFLYAVSIVINSTGYIFDHNDIMYLLTPRSFSSLGR